MAGVERGRGRGRGNLGARESVWGYRNDGRSQEATEMLSPLQIQGLDLKNPHLHQNLTN